MKKIIVTLFILVLSSTAYSQYVPLPTRDLYDSDLMMASLSTTKYFAERRITLKPLISTCKYEAKNYMSENDYRKAEKTIERFFDSHHLYASELPLVAQLYYLLGYCKIELGNENAGIELLKQADKGGDDDASFYLQKYFSIHLTNAISDYYQNDIESAFTNLIIAQKSGYESADWCFYYGKVLEYRGDLNHAREYYKSAKEHGHPEAKQSLKDIKKKIRAKSKSFLIRIRK